MTKIDMGKTMLEIEHDLKAHLQTRWQFRRKVTFQSFIVSLNARLGEACIKEGIPTARELFRSHRDMKEFRDVIACITSSKNRMFSMWLVVEALFGQEVAREFQGVCKAIRKRLSSLSTIKITLSTESEDVEALVAILAKKDRLIDFRFLIEFWLCDVMYGIDEVYHSDAKGPIAKSQRGDYKHRGLMGLLKDGLSERDIATRIPMIAITEENLEIHNYPRFIGGMRQVNRYYS